MAEKPGEERLAKDEGTRRERLAEQLRKNLRRRKEQGRGRKDEQTKPR